MSEAPEDSADDETDVSKAPSRVRFKGIVEQDGAKYGVLTIDHDEERWTAAGRQAWQVSRLTALFVFFSFVFGPPLGSYLAHQQLYGSIGGWNPFAVYSTNTIIVAFIVPLLLLVLGYAMSRMATMMNAAQSIAAAAQQYVTPDVTAAHNADAVGEIVRGHMVALNEGLDGALSRLASVEAMIRQHVEAIEIAGEAIEYKATGAVARVADERSRLMELTESLNAHADSFAAAIAERAKSSIETMQSADQHADRAEKDFEERLGRLEDAAGRAVESFEALRSALRESTEHFTTSTKTIDDAARETQEATKKANAAADAAAESAARNAANVAASAARALETSRKAADDAIEAAKSEAERIADAAIGAAAEQAGRVQDAASESLAEMSEKTNERIEAARAEAEKAVKAASDVSEAARIAGEAAQQASGNVSAAGEEARRHSEGALAASADAAQKIEDRNRALADARAALEKENKRLEDLIEEQRQRADRLAEAIASQTERLTRLAEAQLREQEVAANLAAAQEEAQARAAAEAEKAAEEAREKARQKEQEEKAAARKAEEEKQQAASQDASAPAEEPAELPLGKSEEAPLADGAGAARLDELARDIAERRPRRERKPRRGKSVPERIGMAAQSKSEKEAKSKREISWREILDAADDAEPLELGPAEKETRPSARDEADDAIRTISKLQAFTYDLETRLYGDPPPALQERYERGDRNVFANRLLRLNEADIKRRIRSESARDRAFERDVHDFLQGFEKLLEDATTSETADEELEEYLSSPLGRVYLLIGATVGYFA